MDGTQLVEEVSRLVMAVEFAVRIARWLPWLQAGLIAVVAGAGGWVVARRLTRRRLLLHDNSMHTGSDTPS